MEMAGANINVLYTTASYLITVDAYIGIFYQPNQDSCKREVLVLKYSIIEKNTTAIM
jgi:hypothetical protein